MDAQKEDKRVNCRLHLTHSRVVLGQEGAIIARVQPMLMLLYFYVTTPEAACLVTRRRNIVDINTSSLTSVGGKLRMRDQ